MWVTRINFEEDVLLLLLYWWQVAAVRNPLRYGPIYAYCDELYAGLQLILENYYLKQYSEYQ